MNTDFNALIESLPVMAKGMAGIFVVTGAIILMMILLVKFTGEKKDKEDN